MNRHVVLVSLLATVLFAPGALAEHDGGLPGILPHDPEPQTNGPDLGETTGDLVPEEGPVEADTSLVEDLLSGAADLVSGIGGAIADGTFAVIGAIGSFFGAVWSGVTWAAVGIATGTGIAAARAFDGVLWSVTGVAGLMGDAVTGTFRLIGDGVVGLWNGLDKIAGGIAGARPDGMSEAAWAGTVATSAAGASAAANYGLFEWLRRAGWLGAGVPLFSRIAKDDILEHPLRAEIFDAIKASPGIHISALARTVDAGWGTTIHHLRKLQEKELVAVRMVNNQKCYFQNGGDVSRSAWTQLPELKNATANRIAQYILNRPLSPVTSVSDELGLSPSLVSHHVRKLERAGVVEKIRDGRFVKLAVTDAARTSLFHEEVAGTPTVPVAGVAA